MKLLKATNYVLSKSLPKALATQITEKMLEPYYNYQGGRPTPSMLELSYGMRQMKHNLEPKSLDYFKNEQKIGYYSRTALVTTCRPAS